MAFNGLNSFVEKLEKDGELIRIKDFFDTELEITEVVDRFSKQKDGGKALLFENNGTQFPLLVNALGSDKRICTALNFNDIEQPIHDINNILQVLGKKPNSIWDKIKLLPELKKISDWFPTVRKRKGECQEIIDLYPDLSKLPVLKCWPHDGGRFITFPLVHTKDPNTGIRNLGMYRMQIFDAQTTGMHWHMHKTGARHYNEYKKLGIRMPVSVVLGGDPVYTYSATAPLPDNIDEYILAGFLRKKKVNLVKCITNDLEVPNDADIVIEGYVDPSEELVWEGPFGDHTGFYSLADWYPKFHVTCITHRKNAIYPATIVGIPPQEDAYIAKATEKIFVTPVKLSLAPEVIDFTIPMEGTAHNLVIVKIKQSYPGQAVKVMSSLWGAGQMMFTKTIIVVDETVDIYNIDSVLQAVSQNVDVHSNIHFSSGPTDVLDHASYTFAFSGKIGLDATNKKTAVFHHENSNFAYLKEIQQVVDHKFYPQYTLLLLNVKNDISFDIKELSKQILQKGLPDVKFVVFYDANIDLNSAFMTSWVGLANIDPMNDCLVLQNILIINAMSKSIANEFKRDWPSAIAMNSKTIEIVDQKWEKSINHSFIQSPSVYFKNLIVENNAVHHKNT